MVAKTQDDLIYEDGACRVTFFASSGFRSSRFEGEAIGMERKAYWDIARHWRDKQLGLIPTEQEQQRAALSAKPQRQSPYPLPRFVRR